MASDSDSTASFRASSSDSCPSMEPLHFPQPRLPLRGRTSPVGNRKRVRSGCVTCKIRKVKCDEEKPFCNRCKSTGRKCDGYPAIASKASSQCQANSASRPPSLSPGPSPSAMTLKARELRSLEFFQLRTAPAVGGYFESKFWDRLVLQVAQTEPTIRNAMLAVSTLHELSESIGSAGHELSLRCRPDHPSVAYAVALYTKAMQLLQQRLKSGQDSIPVALIACTLFTCFESLRGNIEPALGHIQSGMNIIKSMKRSERGRRGSDAPNNYLVRTTVEDNLIPVFARMSIMSQTFGQPAWQLIPEEPPEVPIGPTSRKEKYTTIEEARTALVDLITLILHFKHTCNAYRYPPFPTPPAHVLDERDRLQLRLANWLYAFDAFISSNPPSSSPKPHSHAAENVVRIHHAVASGWLKILLSPGERAYDEHSEIFQRIIDLSARCMTAARSQSPVPARASVEMPRYTFDMGLIGPLYWVAARSRDPMLRRQAVELLARGPRREGLWDAHEVALVARRCIELEEGTMWASQPRFQQVPVTRPGLGDGNGVGTGALPVPEEAARIHDCGIEYARGYGRSTEIVATLIMKPDGLQGEWLIKQEKLYREKTWEQVE